MQHASPSVGALAAALAKAQTELVNPEKSLSGTLSSPAPAEPRRTFRYAPLSMGLEIIRKSLGRHEIATIQRTEIDESGLIRLTTVLAHSSGEWLSSDWPVCPASESATPHRLGAALTYARRYALFTLVGIAGEDDADAPDLPLRTGLPNGEPVSGNLPFRNGSGPAVPAHRRSRELAQPTLSPEESARLRQQLETELDGFGSGDELVAWATRILPKKNRLTSQDAALIERAFEARLKVLQPNAEQPEPDAASMSSGQVSDGHVDETAFAIPRTPLRRDRKHLKFVSSQPCLICGRSPSDAHHLRFAQPRALGRKVSDEFTVPLCRAHHRSLHDSGDERAWWDDLQVDPVPVAQQLWSETR